jgi:DNA-directed RNA polymerase subunit RPC12/RpoP
MSATFSFRCPACNARIRAPYQIVGETRACPGCGHRFVVRLPVPQEEGPILVPDDGARPRRYAYTFRKAS